MNRAERRKLIAKGSLPKVPRTDKAKFSFSIGADERHVLLNFSSAINGVKLFPEQAERLGNLLIEHAKKVAKEEPATE